MPSDGKRKVAGVRLTLLWMVAKKELAKRGSRDIVTTVPFRFAGREEYMFESHAVQNQAVQNQAVESQSCLYEGAYVRLDIRWHHNPVFVCEKSGDHFRVAGFEYAGDGRPLRAYVPTPVITGILPGQK